MIEAFIKFEEAHIIWWRKAINDYMMREHGFKLVFYPKIEGEEE